VKSEIVWTRQKYRKKNEIKYGKWVWNMHKVLDMRGEKNSKQMTMQSENSVEIISKKILQIKTTKSEISKKNNKKKVYE
jgi:hypothetical protein